MRNSYSKAYPDIFNDMNLDGPMDKLLIAVRNFIYQVFVVPEPLPPDVEFRLRPFSDALKEALDNARACQTDVQGLSIQRRKELSDIKSN